MIPIQMSIVDICSLYSACQIQQRSRFQSLSSSNSARTTQRIPAIFKVKSTSPQSDATAILTPLHPPGADKTSNPHHW
jgi:hypothetical protein